jgi:hypothetical protein
MYDKYNSVAGGYACLIISESSFYVVSSLVDALNPSSTYSILFNVTLAIVYMSQILAMAKIGTILDSTVRVINLA